MENDKKTSNPTAKLKEQIESIQDKMIELKEENKELKTENADLKLHNENLCLQLERLTILLNYEREQRERKEQENRILNTHIQNLNLQSMNLYRKVSVLSNTAQENYILRIQNQQLQQKLTNLFHSSSSSDTYDNISTTPTSIKRTQKFSSPKNNDPRKNTILNFLENANKQQSSQEGNEEDGKQESNKTDQNNLNVAEYESHVNTNLLNDKTPAEIILDHFIKHLSKPEANLSKQTEEKANKEEVAQLANQDYNTIKLNQTTPLEFDFDNLKLGEFELLPRISTSIFEFSNSFFDNGNDLIVPQLPITM
jgi:hypothetical protein